jgi:hypothetical protein
MFRGQGQSNGRIRQMSVEFVQPVVLGAGVQGMGRNERAGQAVEPLWAMKPRRCENGQTESDHH